MSSGRRWPTLVVVLTATATVLGACSAGGDSGEAAAPRRTVPEPGPSTTVVATTVPDSPTTVAPRPPTTTRRGGSPTTVPRRPAAYPGIYPETTWEALAASEAAFADGHQPWRGSPFDVARLYLEDQLGLAGAAFLSPSGPQGTEVNYVAGGAGGIVHIERPAGTVAVVVASDTSRLEGVQVSRSGDELRVDVTSTAAGSVQAMAGPFQAEWVVDQAREVSPGTAIRFDLDTGLGDAPVLLRLRHEGADGVVSVAERRVN